MLADQVDPSVQSGIFASDVHLPCTSRYRLLDFIAQELPRWRDDPERPRDVSSETQLSEHLCDYLTGVAQHSVGFDCFQFRTETSDEEKRGRKIDLAVKPCGCALWIDGKRHSKYEAIMPIECKRLPTPLANGRDEREYVVVGDGSTGGIQRYKFGLHGGLHNVAAMIGYIQQHDGAFWHKQISGWIEELVASDEPCWSSHDHLTFSVLDSGKKLSRLVSTHYRTDGKPPMFLHHLWVGMS